MKRYTLMLLGLAAVIIVAGALLAIRARVAQPASAVQPTPTLQPTTTDQSAPAAPPTAKAMMSMGSLQLLAPASGSVVSAPSLPVQVAVQDFTLSCAAAGKAPRDGVGHWHLMLDGALVNMYCSTATTLSLQNVAPGTHTITAVLAANNHMGLMGKNQMASTTFVYQPTQAQPLLTPYSAPGKPTISILEPANGAPVGERFQVQLDWTNFQPSCDLLGKKDLVGYGHWHLNIDSMSGPMMGMGTMLAMGCTHTYTVYTDGLTPGPHTLYALLVDNQHAPLMPTVATSITINVQPGTSAALGAAQSASIVTDARTVGRYMPATLHLHVGQSVVFTNTSDAAHTVTADNGAFDSGNIAQGATWRYTATTAGTFAYHCTYHPLMHGTIVVSP